MLGWLVCGPTTIKNEDVIQSNIVNLVGTTCINGDDESDLKSVLKSFWAVEEVAYDEMGIDEKILK